MIVDAHNGFNELIRLAVLWTVRHRWPAGAIFAFNCYKHWAQLLLRQPGDPPGTTLVPLAEDLRAADPEPLSPFYADDAAFNGSARRSVQLLKLLLP